MKTNYFKKITLVVTITLAVTACNKTKKYASRLSGEKWKVSALSVNGVNEAELPTLEFEDCDIYKESCYGEWMNDEGGHAEFIWQFREKGAKFEISNQSELDHGHGHGHAEEEVIEQCQNFSGVYDVVDHNRKTMEIKSSNVIGYPGETVVIKLEKI